MKFANVQGRNSLMRELLSKSSPIDRRTGAKSMLLYQGKVRDDIDRFLDKLFSDPNRIKVLIVKGYNEGDELDEVRRIFPQGEC